MNEAPNVLAALTEGLETSLDTHMYREAAQARIREHVADPFVVKPLRTLPSMHSSPT